MELHELNERLEKLERQNTRILYYLENDPTTGREGFISKLERIENNQRELLKREEIYLTKAGTWGAIAGIVVAVFWKIGDFLLAKWA